MSETSLSDYDPEEYAPTLHPIFCCHSIQVLDHPHHNPSEATSLPARLKEFLKSQRGEVPHEDTNEYPLIIAFYKAAVLIDTTAGYTSGLQKRWLAPVIRQVDGTSCFVQVPKHRIYAAQREGHMEKRCKPGHTFYVGDCPNHPGVEYVVEMYFLGKVDEIRKSEEQWEQRELWMVQSEVEHQRMEEDGGMSRTPLIQQSITPSSAMSQPQSGQQPSMTNTQPDRTTNGILFQALQHRVNATGKPINCDECATNRRICSRGMSPGPSQPKCTICQGKKTKTNCTWNTVKIEGKLIRRTFTRR
ncbi:hypothetical protein N431DRAFT_475540 [Stipitochalara longipes BDJ]|nr:hypothetical protein N431DRAFT_475540 [Stipitochalara longipes BDJ]